MNNLIGELRSFLFLLVGVGMAVIGSRLHDELIRGLGLTIVGTALGITIPGLPQRDPQQRTRATDELQERGPSGR